jgi:hypothetical protein
MSTVNISPVSKNSSKRLPATGTYANVLPMLGNSAAYTSSLFISGAAAAVTIAYKVFGGNILDIELEEENIYQYYQQAILKYSAIINTHHAKNVLYELLGFSTSSFNNLGNITAGSDVATKNPNFSIAYARRMQMAFGAEVGIGGNQNSYSASFNSIDGQQNYDLQSIIGNSSEFSGIVNGKRILVKEVYFQTPLANWRFFGAWGGYGQIGGYGVFSGYSNASTFQVTPVWESKLQAMSFEDNLRTRTSNYSYEIINNHLRLYPIPNSLSPALYWIRFQVENDSWDDHSTGSTVDGINNMNTLPFGNLPLENINSMGHMWIREYFLALCAKYLGLIRGKVGPIPLAKGNVTLNSADLLSIGKEDLDKLEDKLVKILDDMARKELAERKRSEVEANMEIMANVPLAIWVR